MLNTQNNNNKSLCFMSRNKIFYFKTCFIRNNTLKNITWNIFHFLSVFSLVHYKRFWKALGNSMSFIIIIIFFYRFFHFFIFSFFFLQIKQVQIWMNHIISTKTREIYFRITNVSTLMWQCAEPFLQRKIGVQIYANHIQYRTKKSQKRVYTWRERERSDNEKSV